MCFRGLDLLQGVAAGLIGREAEGAGVEEVTLELFVVPRGGSAESEVVLLGAGDWGGLGAHEAMMLSEEVRRV